MKKFILEFEDGTIKEVLNTDNKISFMNSISKLIDHLIIENNAANEGILLLRDCVLPDIDLIKVTIINNNDAVINFDKQIDEMFYYYEYDSIHNTMREYLEIRFAREV